MTHKSESLEHARNAIRFICCVVAVAFALFDASGAMAATVRATYFFNNTLAAQEAGAPILTATDPLSMNSFEDSTVYGQTRRVYHWVGFATPPNQNAGLSVATTGLIPSNSYSIELVFQFLDHNNDWRRIIDVQNRTNDNGFYVDPGNHLNVVSAGPLSGGSTAWTNNTYHHVVLTDASTSTVKGYLDGNLEFTFSTSVMHINNPVSLLNLFIDEVSGAAPGEYSNGRIALFRLYDGILTDGEVRQLGQNPFTPATCDIQLNKTSFITGDQVVAQILRIANLQPTPTLIEYKLWFSVPGSGSISFVRGGADESVALSAGFNQDFGPVSLGTVTSASPRGAYAFNCRFLNPVTGASYVEELNPFLVQ